MGLSLTSDSKARKNTPITTGVIDYFPAALAAVARLSKYGNDKHNPGEPLHWARGKSPDHADCIVRHLIDRGEINPETGESHTVELVWRALALLQLEEEERLGLPMSRGSKLFVEAGGLTTEQIVGTPIGAPILVTPRGIIPEDKPAKIDDGPPRTRAKLIESALLDGHTHRTFLFKTSRDGKITYYLNESGERWRCDGCGTDSIFEYYNSLDRVKKYMHELPEQRGILCSASGCNGLVVPPRG